MFDPRFPFLRTFCSTCIQPCGHAGCGKIFRSILQPIQCPEELTDTHIVCSFCLDLHPRLEHHEKHCIFAQEQVKLYTGGWATPASNQIRRTIRRAAFPYRAPLINLIRTLIVEFGAEEALIVPIPMSCAGRGDRWTEMVRSAASNLDNMKVASILKRDKVRSTRKNVAQVRAQIVRREYKIDKSAAILSNQRILLLDDNVTTGWTMTHCIKLFKQLGVSEVIPLTIDRTISARVLQRCPNPPDITCSFYIHKE